jgi:polyhydroxyalkanoate synthesis regulator phasin
MPDFDIHKTMIKKGIEFKVKNGELTEEQAKELINKLDKEA